MSNPDLPSLLPANALDPQQWNAITQAIAGLSPAQLNWVSGYIAGLAATAGAPVATLPTTPAEGTRSAASTLTVLFGSQTGNSKGVAEQLYGRAQSEGIAAKLVSMADYKPRQIKNESHIAVVVSTHGEGDAPDDAVELHEFLASKKAPKLSGTEYSVLGLGDTSYEFFCQTGKDFDARLSALGAKAILQRVDCDVDYEAAVTKWIDEIIEKLKASMKTSEVSAAGPAATSLTAAEISPYTKAAPFDAALLVSQKITGRDSVKDIRHIEISLEDSGITYQPGDALGVWFKNDQALVDELISLTQNEPDTTVSIGDKTLSLRDALIERLELTLSYPGFIKAYYAQTQNAALGEMLQDSAKLRAYLEPRQIIDVVRDFPSKVDAAELVAALRPLTPRLYSIASSQSEVEDEVHLTVAHVDYQAYEKRHQGGASGFLCERLEEGANVGVYIEKNDNFRLPADNSVPIIMIGPGTGIAPFRAFVQEREAQDATGKNWLFFGNLNFTQDFLYQTEWQGYKKSGLLQKLTLAFSRDQKDKIYVQHRLLEHGKDVFAWLEEGAHLYVCGDAKYMAKDVESALLEIIEKHGNKSATEAKQYLLAMRKAKRYQKDVY